MRSRSHSRRIRPLVDRDSRPLLLPVRELPGAVRFGRNRCRTRRNRRQRLLPRSRPAPLALAITNLGDRDRARQRTHVLAPRTPRVACIRRGVRESPEGQLQPWRRNRVARTHTPGCQRLAFTPSCDASRGGHRHSQLRRGRRNHPLRRLLRVASRLQRPQLLLVVGSPQATAGPPSRLESTGATCCRTSHESSSQPAFTTMPTSTTMRQALPSGSALANANPGRRSGRISNTTGSPPLAPTTLLASEPTARTRPAQRRADGETKRRFWRLSVRVSSDARRY